MNSPALRRQLTELACLQMVTNKIEIIGRDAVDEFRPTPVTEDPLRIFPDQFPLDKRTTELRNQRIKKIMHGIYRAAELNIVVNASQKCVLRLTRVGAKLRLDLFKDTPRDVPVWTKNRGTQLILGEDLSELDFAVVNDPGLAVDVGKLTPKFTEDRRGAGERQGFFERPLHLAL